MKKPLLLLIMSGLGMLCLHSQTIEASYENSFNDEMNYIFENLDFSEVTTDLLLDRSMPLIEVDSFDGVQLLEYNRLDINRFGLIYATFFGAALDTSALLPHPDRYMLARDSLQMGDAIPIAVIHLDYHRFKKNAVDSNLVFVQDGQLHDTPNRPQSPYQQKKAFGVTPVLGATDTLDITFSLPDSLLFTNSDSVALFEIDLDDGNGYQLLAFNQQITANYSEAGEKELLFKVTLADSSVQFGHAKFIARGTGVNANFGLDADKDYSLTPDMIVPIPATTDHEYGEMQIGFGCSDLGLRKPLLYVQGYFPQIGDEKPQGYGFLLDEPRFGQSANSSNQIIDILELENYDIIYLQLSYSGDVVDRNAEIVKKAIRELNEMLDENGSNEQIIVIGASMGGLLSKYALLEMEQAGENHNVKTLITLDTPFNGANIPVGMQFLLLHLLNLQVSFVDGLVSFTTTSLSGFVPEIGQTNAAINGGFVQEALIYNIFEMPNIYQQLPNNLTGLTLTKPEHTSFYTNLEAMGDLQNCEHVAFSNGSAIGEGQSFGPGDQLLEMSGWAGDIYEELGIGEPWSQILEGVGIVFLGTHISFDFNVYALPDNPSSYTKVYKGNTFVSVLFGALAANASSFEGKVKETVPYDSAPGGTLSFPDGGLPNFINVYHPSFCFLPTVSGLDISSPENEDLYQDLSDVPGVTGSGLTTADRYDASTDDGFMSAHNQHHASLNSTNIPFLMAELASDDEMPDELPTNSNGELVLGDRTYNYGDAEGHFDSANPTIRHTPHQIKQTLWVENTGKLWVNRDDRISFTDKPANPNNTTDSHFDLYIQGQDGCELSEAELHIVNNGSMKIGNIAVQNTADVYVMEDAKVFVNTGGEMIMERSSNMIVENGGEINIGGSGLYQTHGDSETRVNSGGMFRVESGGILRIVDESKLLVGPGGQLILEEGATVQLWDNTQPDGLANIHVQGELIINGSFDFSGSGFFQFDAGHVLTLASGVDFEIVGSGQGKRFIRLNQNADLDIGSHGINLSNGKVEYEIGSSIVVGDQGAALMVNVDFIDLNEPGRADALLAFTTPEFVTVTGCHFEGLVTGVGVNGATGLSVGGGYTRYLRVSNSTFNDCEYAVMAFNTPFVEIVGSDFTTSSTVSLYAIALRDVDGAYVGSTSISGYSDSADGAVSLYNVPDYNMVGGTVSGNTLGIMATGDSNIDMTSHATVSSNTTGIEMYGGDAFGVLTMDCARLLDNDVGVLGTDITLNIDASGELKPNHFRTVTGSPLFQICYNSLAGFFSDPIDAKDNFWEGPKDYQLYDPTLPGYVSCSHYYGNLNLLTAPEAILQDCGNGPGDPSDPVPDPDDVDSNFTGNDPNCLDVTQQMLYDNYWHAYDAYLEETHLVANDRPESDSLYSLVAAIPDNISQGYSKKCKKLIHIARSRVDVSADPQNTIGEGGEQTTVQTTDLDWVHVYPNPVNERMTVRLRLGEYKIKVFNQLGVLVFQAAAIDDLIIDTRYWKNGLYFIEVFDNVKKLKSSHKFNIVRYR